MTIVEDVNEIVQNALIAKYKGKKVNIENAFGERKTITVEMINYIGGEIELVDENERTYNVCEGTSTPQSGKTFWKESWSMDLQTS